MPETQPQDTKLARLQYLAEQENLIDVLDEDTVKKIGRIVCQYAKTDDDSRYEWKRNSKAWMEHALQVVEQKTTPWPGASNIKFPLVTTAALQFHARAYPAIVTGNRVVKAQVTGYDDGTKAAKADRIAKHMNWQILDEDQEWEADMDKLLLALAVEGTEFKKTYFSREKGHNVSEWIRPKNLIVHNETRSFSSCPRITQELSFYPHEIDEKIMMGSWADVELNISPDDEEEEVLQDFYEQHFYYDIDDDGIKEPVIAVVHKDSETPVRLVAGYYVEDIEVELQGKRGTVASLSLALGLNKIPEEQVQEIMAQARVVRVPRIEMFTKYFLIPSPDGTFYDLGFGQLIGPISDSIDTALNQLVDAGTLSNMQAGFIADGVSINSQRGDLNWERGKFKRITIPSGKSIQECIYQMRFAEPSVVLFQLLESLKQAAKDVTSVQDIMSGAAQEGNRETATTTMIRIEQGMKVFNAIYKRIFRSLKDEFEKLYKLNSIFLEPEQYFRVLDTNQQERVTLTDYQGDGTDIQPVADPQLATNLMAMAKNQQIMSIMQHPLINDEEALRRFLEGLDIPAPERLIVPPDQRQAPPDPEIVLKSQIAASEHAERQFKMMNMVADTVKKIAEAEAAEDGPQMQLYMKQLELMQGTVNGQGKPVPVEAPSGNGMGIPQAQGQAAGVV